MSVFRDGLFVKKVCLVTGGGTGIGKAVAGELLSLGATVCIAARNKERLDVAAAELIAATNLPPAVRRRPKSAVEAVQLDIRSEVSVNAVVADLTRRHGRIDYLINNGGGQFASPAAAIRPKGWRAVIDTNLNGTWLMCQALYNNTAPLNRPGQCIVNIIADHFNGFPGMAHTGAARAGVDSLTKTLAREWGPDGMRVNSVAPGIILSSGINNYPPAHRASFFGSSAECPAGRCGSESEVASAVVFLMSPGAAYVTGTTLRVDGGSSLGKKDAIQHGLRAARELEEGVSERDVAVAVARQPVHHRTAQLEAEFDERLRIVTHGESPQPTSKL